jgi:hypothetical protein
MQLLWKLSVWGMHGVGSCPRTVLFVDVTGSLGELRSRIGSLNAVETRKDVQERKVCWDVYVCWCLEQTRGSGLAVFRFDVFMQGVCGAARVACAARGVMLRDTESDVSGAGV